MYHDLTKCLEDSIWQLDDAYSIREKKIQQLEERIHYIIEYDKLKGRVKSLPIRFFLSGLVGTILLMTVLFSAFGNAGVLILGVISYLYTGLSIADYVKESSSLKKDYLDISNLSDDELYRQFLSLLEEKLNVLSEQIKIVDSKAEYEEKLQKVASKVISICENKENIEKSKKNVLGILPPANLVSLDDYLTESIDYSHVYFDTNIDNTMDYIEDIKRKVMVK